MVTRQKTIQIWMYKNCYLKFSSQEFSLKNFHESVHLTNHFVQKNYSNATDRSPHLPKCNMWLLADFQRYLEKINEKEIWSKKIFPSMKRCVETAVLCSFDELQADRNCFELYGCDFMITDGFEPILLEINASPDMNHSTLVTAQICPECLEDVVKGKNTQIQIL